MYFVEIILVIVMAVVPVLLAVVPSYSQSFWVLYVVFVFSVVFHSLRSVSRKKNLRDSEYSSKLNGKYRIIEDLINEKRSIPSLKFTVWVKKRIWFGMYYVIVHSKNYDENLVRFWKVKEGIGLLGDVFGGGDSFVEDMSACSVNKLVNQGYSFLQAMVLKGENSAGVVAIPIKDTRDSSVVYGVLRIDDSSDLREVFVNNEKLQEILERIACEIAEYLK